MQPVEVYALCTVALFLKFFAVAAVQGLDRLRHRAFVRPEDAAFFGQGARPAAADGELAALAQNTLRNDLENIPFFLFLGLLYVHSGAWPTGALVYFPLFLVSRVVHTVAYLKPTQPLRNRAYLVGVAVLLALSGHIVHRTLTGAWPAQA